MPINFQITKLLAILRKKITKNLDDIEDQRNEWEVIIKIPGDVATGSIAVGGVKARVPERRNEVRIVAGISEVVLYPLQQADA